MIPQLLGPPRNQDGLTPGQVYFSFLSSVIAGEDCMGSSADTRGPLRVRGSQSIQEPARLDTAPLLLHLLRHEAPAFPLVFRNRELTWKGKMWPGRKLGPYLDSDPYL